MRSLEMSDSLVVLPAKLGEPEGLIRHFSDQVENVTGMSVKYDYWPSRFIGTDNCPYGMGLVTIQEAQEALDFVRDSSGVIVFNTGDDFYHQDRGEIPGGMRNAVGKVARTQIVHAPPGRVFLWGDYPERYNMPQETAWPCNRTSSPDGRVLGAYALKGNMGQLVKLLFELPPVDV